MTSARDRLISLFRGDGTQTHYELISNRGGRHGVPAMDAADIILDALHPASAHPEDCCNRCYGPLPSWHAASPLWNAVMRNPRPEPYNGIVCPNCFAALAHEAGVTDHLCVTTHDAQVELATTFGDGRVWSADECRWVEETADV